MKTEEARTYREVVKAVDEKKLPPEYCRIAEQYLRGKLNEWNKKKK